MAHSSREGKPLMSALRNAAFRTYFRWSRSLTLGARVAVVDAEGRFLLVRHAYVRGWNFPGGGVEKGETCLDAALRELREEACVTPLGALQLHGIFSNERIFRGDHVALFVLREFSQTTFVPNREIAEAAFFHVDELPAEATDGVARRIAEIREGLPPAPHW